MNQKYYSDERNAQIVLALLKAYGIRKMVLSPGSTNLAIVGSVQNDPYFQLWSAVDERHAAYLACGIAGESGEPVVISCTGATAARNYMPGMTEAYYRKLPILCLTSTQEISHLRNGYTEMTDRTRPPSDVAKLSVRLPPVFNDHEAQECERIATRAILELFGSDGGPVHICLETFYSLSFSTRTLPRVSTITRIYPWTRDWPALDRTRRIVILAGARNPFDQDEANAIRMFAEKYDAVVLTDPVSGYHGEYSVQSHLICVQPLNMTNPGSLAPGLIIYMGGLCGDYATTNFLKACKAPVWRVSADGSPASSFGGPSCVFVMPEKAFFDRYLASDESGNKSADNFSKEWMLKFGDLSCRMPEWGFSNLWISRILRDKIPGGSCVHLGIFNSLTTWSYFPYRSDLKFQSNVGGFGIDGCLSTAIGASLASPKRLHFLIVGDLAFFYDMNSIGNRHVGKNLRILLVNNGAGATFNMYFHPSACVFGEQTNDYTAAAQHFGAKSKTLVKHLAEDLGFKYLAANSKTEFEQVLPEFVANQLEQPIIFECFVDLKDETASVYAADHIENAPTSGVGIKEKVKALVPQRVKKAAKELLR